MSASTSRTLPPEIAESESVMALIERGKADGQIAGDDVRRAFEADQIPPTQWKNVLRSLNQILEEEGVTLMVSAAEPSKRARKSVAAKSPVKRTATKTVAAKTTVTRTVAATAAPSAETVDTASGAAAAGPAKKAAAKKTAAKKTAVKKTAAKKTTAKKSGKQDDELLDGDEAIEEVKVGKGGEEEEGEGENKGFV
ncbi:RNA polymerase sigma factor, partial [Streptomyces sp. NPDC057496]